MIKYGVLLPWTGHPRRGVRREYPLPPEDYRFVFNEMNRWVAEEFAEEITEAEARRVGLVVSGFVVHGSKPRVVIDYSTQKEVLESQKFRMDTLADLAPQLRPGDSLIKADVQDAYYHLRLRRCDRDKLHFQIAGRFFRPLALNCGLSAAPWLFTKFLRPVVQELRRQGHRIISYLDDLSGATRTECVATPASQADATRAGQEIQSLFAELGLKLRPTKTDCSVWNYLGLWSTLAGSFTSCPPRNCARSHNRPEYSAKLVFDANDDAPSTTFKDFVDWKNP
jgi:Reverse transcriptase (RNA-dependent DNA polymerase)